MSNKILTVSIASYNAEKDISRCLDSFIASNVLEKLDIIVVNDGSSDNTSKIAHDYEDKYSSIRVVDKSNGGHGSTINTGIIEAEGKYFRIVDSDDWVDPIELNKFVNYLENCNADIVFTPYQTVNSLDKSIIKTYDNFHCNVSLYEETDINFIDKKTLLAMHAMTFKTSCIKKVGPIIDEHCFYVDTEYCIYPLSFAKSFVFINSNVYKYSIGSQNQSVSINNLIKRRNEHARVVKSLCQYYLKNKLSVHKTVRNLIYRYLKNLISFQMYLYVVSNSSDAKREMIEFDRYLSVIGFSTFNCLNSIKNKFGYLILKLTKFTTYSLFSSLYVLYKKK